MSKLDRAIHEPARLGILVALAGRPDGMLFPALRRACRLTGGNLARHLATLREEGLVEIWKGPGAGRGSQTLVRMTPGGRRRFAAYLRALRGMVAGALPASTARVRRRPPAGAGWSRK